MGAWEIDTHKQIMDELHCIYKRKNADYGNAFQEQVQEYGQIAPLIRIEEKFKRYKNLVLIGKGEVEDETLQDTLLDLANYCVLTVIELRRSDYEESRCCNEKEK